LSFEAFVYINANKMVAYLKVPGMCYCNGTSLEYYISWRKSMPKVKLSWLTIVLNQLWWEFY